MGFSSGMKDIGRVTHILNVLFRHGMGYFIQKHGLKPHLPFSKRLAVHKYKKPVLLPSRIRKAMEEIGGAYVKLGQMLSIRPDLIPGEYCREFSKLQDKVPPFSFEKAKEIVEKETGKPLRKTFKSFEEKPIGSASVSQVHEAKLLNGRKVVVKVQRPGVREIFREDIEIMHYFAKKLENHDNFKKYSPTTIVKEFERYTKNELNFLVEAGNIERFYENLKGTKYVKIPKVYSDYTTKNILTMEFVKGEKLSDVLRERKKFNKSAVKDALFHTCLKQVFEQDIFHADLHPGNILLLDKGRIALLDFGIVGSLTPYLRKEGVKFYVALVNRDIDSLVRQVFRIGKPSANTDMESLRKDFKSIVSRWHGTELRQERVSNMMLRLFESCIDHEIQMPIDIILLGKALVTVEGTGLMLDPKFNFVKESKGYISRYIHMGTLSRESFRSFLSKSKELAEVLQMIPSGTVAVLEKLKHGIVKIDIEDTDLRRLALDIDKSSNRLSYSMVLAALIISGALMMHADVGPYYYGISVPALVLYIIAAFMCFALFVSIAREGAVWR